MRTSAVAAFAFSVFLAGCQCGHKGTVRSTGEVLWQWGGDGGTLFASEADVVFPLTDMGSTRELRVTIQNIGSSAFTIKEFVNLSGGSAFLNAGDDENAAFKVKWVPGAVVAPAETTVITVTFKPPVTTAMPAEVYSATADLRPSGADSSRMYLRGSALAPDCFVPELLELGSIPLLSTRSAALSLRNIGLTSVVAKAGPVTGVPSGTFQVIGLNDDGTLEVPSGAAAEAQVVFKPRVAGDFTGVMTMQRSAVCPERTVTFRGRGVDACVTWRAAPPGDAQGRSLDFGDSAVRGVAKGNVTFQNGCTYDVNLNQMRTSDSVFSITNTSMTTYSAALPAAVLKNGAWVDGTVNGELEFHPEALGPKMGQLLADTSDAAQPMIALELRGLGVGPRIDVQPLTVLVGRVGYLPSESPKSFAERKLSITNKGTLPEPPNDALNLHLGSALTGRYWSVVTVSGLLSELCVGGWNSASDTCAGTLPLDEYDPAMGIDATPTRILELPLRVVPSTDGDKEWLITLYSDDPFTPQVVVRVTATAVSPPPVKVTCPAAVTVDANSQVPLSPTVTPLAGATCAWTVGSRPMTSNGTFSSPASCTMTNYFADVAGKHMVTFSARDAQGETSQCSTEITVKPKGDLWVELTWDKPNDVDLHVLHPMAGAATSPASWQGLYDCHFANRTPLWSTVASQNPSLDRDDTSEKGPENTRINAPSINVVYSIGAHLYASKSSGPVKSTVKVYCDGVLVTTRTRSLTESQVKSMWVVGTVDYGAVAPCRFRLIDAVLPRVPGFAHEAKP